MKHILNEGYKEALRATEARGAYIKISGAWCLDTQMGSGAHILGHGFSSEYMSRKLNEGTLFIYPNETADRCGELLNKATGFKNFIFANSGMEAVSKAIRVSRAYTKRDKVAFMEGGWHGCQDYGLVGYSKGIPEAVADTVITLPFSDKAFEIIEDERPAVVVIEPVQGSFPKDRTDFIKKLREVTKKNKVLLCFDEVLSGFRIALGGGVEYYKTKPDLACYGKIVGGGFPVGIIAGDKVLETGGVKFGGTFSANPVTAAACEFILEALINTNPYPILANKTETLLMNTGKIQIIGLCNYYRILFTGRKCESMQDRDEHQMPKEKINRILRHLLMDKHIYVGSNHKILLSDKHSFADIRYLKECLASL